MSDQRSPRNASFKVDNLSHNKMLLGFGILVLFLVNAATSMIATTDDKNFHILCRRLAELVGLMVVLGVASPFNAYRLYQLEDAEQAIVILEWMKAYIGRLLGPFVAVVIYTQVGYGPLLSLL